MALAFFVAVYFFLNTYNSYLTTRENIESRSVRLRLLNDQKKEIDGKRRIVRLTNAFLAKSNSHKLEIDNWATHEVSMQQPVYFSDLQQIVNQCSSTADYYFRPVSLHLKTAQAIDDEGPQEADNHQAAPSPEIQDGNLLLTLQGQFIVGPR